MKKSFFKYATLVLCFLFPQIAKAPDPVYVFAKDDIVTTNNCNGRWVMKNSINPLFSAHGLPGARVYKENTGFFLRKMTPGEVLNYLGGPATGPARNGGTGCGPGLLLVCDGAKSRSLFGTGLFYKESLAEMMAREAGRPMIGGLGPVDLDSLTVDLPGMGRFGRPNDLAEYRMYFPDGRYKDLTKNQVRNMVIERGRNSITGQWEEPYVRPNPYQLDKNDIWSNVGVDDPRHPQYREYMERKNGGSPIVYNRGDSPPRSSLGRTMTGAGGAIMSHPMGNNIISYASEYFVPGSGDIANFATESAGVVRQLAQDPTVRASAMYGTAGASAAYGGLGVSTGTAGAATLAGVGTVTVSSVALAGYVTYKSFDGSEHSLNNGASWYVFNPFDGDAWRFWWGWAVP